MTPAPLPRLLWVVPRVFYPAASGGELRVLALLKALRGRYQVTLLAPLASGEESRDLDAGRRIEALGLARFRGVRRGPAIPQALRGLPPDARWACEPGVARAVSEAAARGETDLVQLEFSEMGQYAPAAAGKVPVVLTEHDAGVFSGERSYLRPDPSASAAERERRSRERRRYEWSVLGYCDRVIALSEADRALLAELTPPEKIRVVPMGVDWGHFGFGEPQGRREDEIVYLGHYPHYPNEDAAVRLCREIFPLVRGRRPAARLTLVGSDPTPPVRALAGPGVEVTGTVPDVRPFLRRARVFAAPVRLGHGVKGKFLEAFACGVPCVATPEAVEGLPDARDGEHLLLARTARQFAAAIERLLADAALGERLARGARALVEARYGWDRQAELLAAVYGELLGPARARLQEAR